MLVLVSICMYGLGTSYSNWKDLAEADKFDAIMGFIKVDLWEVLAIIGICQVFILPVVASRPAVRILALLGCAAVHVAITYWFNYAFVMGQPNVLSSPNLLCSGRGPTLTSTKAPVP